MNRPMTRIEKARRGEMTDEVREVARAEQLDPEHLLARLASGEAVITRNRLRESLAPLGIGRGLRVKVNANIGTSGDAMKLSEELEKARVAVEAGAHTLMDLSTGGDLREIRKEIMEATRVPLGTVPIYEAAARVRSARSSFCHMSAEDMFRVIEEHFEHGVDFITVHCGVNRETAERMDREGRIMGVVSRGGALLISWMKYNEKDNPFYTHFDRLCELAARYDATLSLGDGFRPGATGDATDRAQIQELIVLGELQQRALEQGVQVIIEGPGHVPMDQIQANVLLQKRLCHGAPFYVLGPLATDTAPGYDHITGAIGGALSAWAGADFLCYVTPAEHLRLPLIEDVREGVIASRIAAQAADLARGRKDAWERERQISTNRHNLDWEGMYEQSLDPQKARANHAQIPSGDKEVCSMCGDFCAIKVQRGAVTNAGDLR